MKQTKEKWRFVPGTRKYKVSNLGRLKSVGWTITKRHKNGTLFDVRWPSKIIKSLVCVDGYVSAPSHCKHLFSIRHLHRIVWTAFKGPIPKGMEINHDDGDKKNNALSNLELMTPSENQKHALRTGLKKIRTRISDETVAEMRHLYDTGQMQLKALSEKYGTPPNHVWGIVTRRSRNLPSITLPRIWPLMKTWLLLDVNFLAHRAYYSTGGLTYREIKTGVIYGVLRDILNLQELHYTNRLAFCFDSKVSKRKGLSTEYKADRAAKYAAMQGEEKRTWDEFRTQIQLLRREYLPSLGFQNIFCQKGYEADDLIASLCDNLETDQRAVIVSADGDLLQCLSDKVSIWHPQRNRMITSKSFRDEYNIHPAQWSQVKAIAGCVSDNVKGVKGVGEKTACKWVRGALKPKDKAYHLISNNIATQNLNLQLTRLPFPGIKPMKLVRDKFDRKAWKELTKRFGLRSLEGRR